MSGPGGTVTKRDQRRATRQQQFQQRQEERRRQRQREIQRQRLTRGGLIGAGVLLVIILAIVISQFVLRGNSSPGAGGSVSLQTHPATGQTVDGMTCLPQQGGGMHIHQYLELYINGQRVEASPGIGIPQSAQCLYPLHVHDNEANIIHNEAAAPTTFTLGQFFDVWGVKLSSSQVGQYKVDQSHKLVVEVFDANGKMTTITDNPYNLQLQDQETIYILYNSPNVKPVAYNGWASFEG